MSINNISNIVLSGNPNTTLNIVDDEAAKSADLSKLQGNVANLDSELAEKLRVKSGGIIIFTDVFANGEFDVISKIEQKQTGSGDPSRDNIRPIIGYDSIKLSRTGKNLLKPGEKYQNTTLNGITFTVNDDKTLTISGGATASTAFRVLGTGTGADAQPLRDLGLLPGEKYTLSTGKALPANVSLYGYYYSANNELLSSSRVIPGSDYGIMDIPANADKIYLYFSISEGATIATPLTIYPMIVKGSAVGEYERYKGNTFTIAFGQNIYGGTFNWSTGELIISKEIVILDGYEQQFDRVEQVDSDNNSGNFYAYKKIKPSVSHNSLICSHLISGWTAGYDYGYTYIANEDRSGTYSYLGSDIDTLEKANTWLKTQADEGTPFTICYELKDPITIQFPSHRISSIPEETNYLFGNTPIIAQQNLAINKAYVDKKLGDSGTNTVEGQYSVALGQNSTAYGDSSISMGANAIAGCMGYYVTAIDPDKRYIYLATKKQNEKIIPVWENQESKWDQTFDLKYKKYTPEQIEEQELPTYIHEFSISSNHYHHWAFAGDIIEINGNRITYSESNLLNGPTVDKNSLGYQKWINNYNGKAEPMKFYIPAQPHIGNITIGLGSHAEGWETIAAGEHTHAEGWYTIAAGRYGHAEGDSTRAGYGAHAEGVLTLASGLESHAEGEGSQAIGDYSHAEGGGTTASGKWSHAEGSGTVASGMQAHAEGANTKAKGGQSHSEGRQTFATGSYSHAGGYQSWASGIGSFAHGVPITPSASVVREPDGLPDDSTKATGHYSVAIGQGVWATGAGAAAFGIGNKANYYGTFTYGQGNIASQYNALAGGSISEAKHSNSTSIGRGTRTSRAYQTAIGLWNKDNTGALFIIGNGKETSDKETGRANAFRVNTSGNIYAASSTVNTGADYAEFFEWQDGNLGAEDRIGYVVTLDEDKIRLAQEGEEILGVISGTAGVVGDGGAMDWQGRFVKDAFGRIIYDEVEEFEEYLDPETQETIRVSLGMAKHPRISPDYNPEEKYIPREERPEWACVGMFGKLYVRDDGTCIPNAYARCVNGVLTYSSERTNIKVMKRTDSNIVYVFLK